jgi:hypothetical protein
MLTALALAIPARWGLLLSRVVGLEAAYRMFSGTWNDWELPTEERAA